MDHHGRIMNIECLPPARMNQHPVDPECSAYRIGHRDARHAAAEIACEAQAEIARLREALVATFDALDRSSSPFPLSIEMTLAVLDHAKAALSGDAL